LISTHSYRRVGKHLSALRRAREINVPPAKSQKKNISRTLKFFCAHGIEPEVRVSVQSERKNAKNATFGLQVGAARVGRQGWGADFVLMLLTNRAGMWGELIEEEPYIP
jgi:hypothetical protein